MKSGHLISHSALSLLLFLIAVTASGKFEFCDEEMATTLGGVHESGGAAENSTEIDGLGRFAVEEHNKKGVCFDILLFSLSFLFHLGFFCLIMLNVCVLEECAA